MKIIVLRTSRCSRITSSCMSRRISGSSARERLVEQHDLGIGGERARQADPLLHPAGQLVGIGAPPSRRGRRSRAPRSPWPRAPSFSTPRISSPNPTLSTIRRCGSRPKCWNTIEIFVRRTSRNRSSSSFMMSSPSSSTSPGGGVVDPVQHPHEGRLPRARQTHHDEDLARRDVERHVAHGGDAPGLREEVRTRQIRRRGPHDLVRVRAVDLPHVATRHGRLRFVAHLDPLVHIRRRLLLTHGEPLAFEPTAGWCATGAERATRRLPSRQHPARRARPRRVRLREGDGRADDRNVRLRDHRRRLRRQRDGQSPVRRPGQPGPRAGGRPLRLPVGRLHPHAGRARVPDRQPVLRLEVRVRARAAHERAQGLSRARQGPGRLLQHQRHDLPARQPARLRALGRRPGHGDLGLRALPALLQADGILPGRRARRPVPRALGPARPRAGPGHQPAVRRLLRGGAAGRLSADRGRQRLPAGGVRAVRPERARRQAPLRRPRLPPPRDAPAEPRGADARVRLEDPVRGDTGGGRRVHARALDAPRARRGGRAVRRRDQLPADPDALGGRAGRAPQGARHRPRRRRAGRRREPPGPPRGLHPVQVPAAGVGRALHEDVAPAVRRRRVAASSRRARAPPTTSRRAGSRGATRTSPTPT